MKRRLITAVTAALAFASAPALAQSQETEGARLFRLGRAAMLGGRFDEACAMLSDSQRLEPHVGTLLNLAACDERRERYGSAWVEYQKSLTAARTEGQTDRIRLAEQRIKAIEPRVPWLRISTTTSELTITLDSGDIVKAAIGTEMPVDPGPHVVTASREGKRVFEEKLELHEGERRTVTITPPLPLLPEGPEGPLPERVIVEPKPPGPSAPATKATGRWVLEPGIFTGFMTATIDHPRLSTSSEENLPIFRDPPVPGDRPTSCSLCSPSPLASSSYLVGLSFFGGYAVSDSVALGLRVLGAPSIGPGGFFAFGPAAVLRASSALSIGIFFTFGDASMSGDTNVTIPAGFKQAGGNSLKGEAGGTLAGGPGIGLDVSLKIADLQRGSLALTLMPTFLSGNGSAFALPVGVAYRFQ